MSKAKHGDTVQIHYTGALEDGTIFDSSREREPLEFTIGSGMVIPGFEAAVDGMAVGENKKVDIQPAEAYGEFNDNLVVHLKRSLLPSHIEPEVGLNLQIRDAEGQTGQVMITEVAENEIVVDGNHPLAGKTLVFQLELMGIK